MRKAFVAVKLWGYAIAGDLLVLATPLLLVTVPPLLPMCKARSAVKAAMRD
jgi:hypothetical protein